MKFNTRKREPVFTKNHEDAGAYSLGKKLELYTVVLTSLLSNTFYEKGEKRLARIQRLVKEIGAKEPAFIAKLAIYAREKMYLRSVPLVLMTELAKVHNGDGLVRAGICRVIKRPDEITELLAYYQQSNSRNGTKKLGKLSKQVQKGIADSFNKFDEYQFAKYDRKTEVSLRDALFLTHPKAKNEEQQKLFDKIVAGTLSVPYTWETEMSKTGQETHDDPEAKAAAFRQKWEELIHSGKLGYMALLRNLRNLLDYNVSGQAVIKAGEQLSDPARVKRSKQLPFRFYAAYRELKGHESGLTPYLLDSLEQAIRASVENLKGFDEQCRVLIATDMSGSMCSPLSEISTIGLYEVGLVLSCLLKSKCKHVITGLFGTTYKRVQEASQTVLGSVNCLSKMNVGYCTNGYLAIKDLIDRKEVVDKVLIFTDCQLWNSKWRGNESIAGCWKKYKKIAPDAKIYLFDLQGYGTTPLNYMRKDVFLIGGWSEKIFEVLTELERGQETLEVIESIEI